MSTLLTKEVRSSRILKGDTSNLSEVCKEIEVSDEELKTIKDHWNSINLTQVKEESGGFDRKVKRCIAKYGIHKLKELTNRYDSMYHDKSYFFNYKYVPTVFYCSATLEKFEDGGNLWEAYVDNKKMKLEKQEEIQEKNKDFIYDEELYFKILSSLKSMPYKSYLKTEHWQHFRKEVIEHYDGKCAVCNSEKDLNVHHRSYKNRGRETFNDVVLLCRDCHSKIHEISGETNE